MLGYFIIVVYMALCSVYGVLYIVYWVSCS